MEKELKFEMDYEHLMAALKDYAEEVRALYRQRLIQDDKYASGKLIQNMKTDVKVMGTEFTVVLYLEDYWKYVEEGREPGKKWPPRDKILEWIKIKPIEPEQRDGQKLPTPEQLSYLIQRKIGVSGITAGHQLRDTVESVNAYWIPKLQAALQEDFDTYTIKVFQAAGRMLKI